MKQRRVISVRLTLSVTALILLMACSVAGLGCKSNSTQARSVQDFAGMSEQDARAALDEAGLSLEVVYQPGSDDQVGVVIGQDPASGQKLEEAATITLTIGIKQQVEVPDLAGLTQNEAAAKLAEMGLSPNPSAQDTDQEALAGLVLTQEPAVGTKVDKGSQVAITVGNYVQPADTANTGSSHTSASYVTCSTCGGSGKISKVINIPKQVPCSSCSGAGFVETPMGYVTCSTCGGARFSTEWVYERTDEVTCSTCGGSGKVRQ